MSQRLALLLLFNATDGAGWINSTGWPYILGLHAMTLSQITQYLSTVPMQSGTCSSNGTMLPDHCCWYGISCCDPTTCANDPLCNCTTGTVTGVQLSNNQVSPPARTCFVARMSALFHAASAALRGICQHRHHGIVIRLQHDGSGVAGKSADGPSTPCLGIAYQSEGP